MLNTQKTNVELESLEYKSEALNWACKSTTTIWVAIWR